MSWLSRDPNLRDDEWGLLDFSLTTSEAFIAKCCAEDSLKGPTVTSQRWSLLGEDDWKQWLDGDHLEQKNDHFTRVNLVIGGRMPMLENMPFTRDIFEQIRKKLGVHSSIVRVINRNTSCRFSKMAFCWQHEGSKTPSIVYNCRTAATWEGDMALSITFFPKTLTTNAVWYGGDLSRHDIHGHQLTDADVITGRLSNFDGGAFHPMLLPTIFADFERDRQVMLVRKILTQCVQRILDLDTLYSQSGDESVIDRRTYLIQNASLSPKVVMRGAAKRLGICCGFPSPTYMPSHSAHQAEGSRSVPFPCIPENEESSVILWVRISHLRNGLENWRTQLLNMISHVQELDDTDFSIEAPARGEEWKCALAALRESGTRISERLGHLVDECDEFIRECTHIMSGLTLATQLELTHIGRLDAKTNEEISRSNLQVAETAQRDGSLMKSIAILGMIYLPATFVSSFFSMTFFQWRMDSNHGIISPDFWIYVVVTVTFTFLTMGIFYVFALRKRHHSKTETYL